MKAKIILVVIDGLRDDVARAQMGYLEHLVERHIAERYTVTAELPTVSRPLYETIQTGTPPSVHGVTSNSVVRRSNQPNLFDLVSKQGGVTAAAAYWWVSELYNQVPYDHAEAGEVDDPALAIQHGRFYMRDEFPDLELFMQAERLIRRCAPDYTLIHPMGMDYAGHEFGGESREYSNHAGYVDYVMGGLLPGWMEKGYTILITADHGMNAQHSHGGTGDDVRRVPLYLIRPGVEAGGEPHGLVSQLQIAPTILKLMGLPAPSSMREPALL